MKRSRQLAALALGLAALLTLSGCQEEEAIHAIQVNDVDVAKVKDGEYRAFLDYKIVTAEVQLSVQGGVLTQLRLVRHDHGPGHGADALLPRILKAQGLAVDAVSGATGSSKVVLKAVETALEKGL